MLRENSDSSFLRKFYGNNLDNLLRLRLRRQQLAATELASATIKGFPRPASDSRLVKPKSGHYSVEKVNSQRKLYKQLSSQLKEIQQSIARLGKSRPKKPSRQSLKVMTEPAEDPKSKIYRQVLNQIDELKQKGRGAGNALKQPAKSPSADEQTMFYGVDFIDGVQFKIQVKLGVEKYYLMAKNAHAKLMLEMPAQEYLKLHRSLLKGNPCGIFHYLTIDNNQLRLKIGQKKPSKSVKSYLNYY
jgi:hypothetical protein